MRIDFDTPLIQDEPELDISFPNVTQRPPRPEFRKHEHDTGQLLAQLQCSQLRGNKDHFSKSFQRLLHEFSPGLQWLVSCWDFVLTTRGLRYLRRPFYERACWRGDYRAFLKQDFERLVHQLFRLMLEEQLGNGNASEGFDKRLDHGLWTRVIKAYQDLENPEDKRERTLTAYSYLRCVPYQFLNPYHQRRVYDLMESLPEEASKPVQLYFLRFHHVQAAGKNMGITDAGFEERLFHSMRRIERKDRLVCALLRQIERY
ncbi:MAG: hypothetical protein JW937_06465 [Candidatus Omnitrophica bacterium]|nr:hypothetical protein [Candidatus Omnitrophota bacterium]